MSVSDEKPAIVLASTSPSRRALLENAGLAFTAMRPEVDERAIEAPYLKTGAAPAFLAGLLSRQKALDVSARAKDALVIGGDQVMEFAGRPYSKPESRDEARDHLKRLSGRSHCLISAFAIARNGAIIFEAAETAVLHMRALDDRAIDRYLALIPDDALFSSGVYQLEGPGVQLFSKIEGDFFTILGLPMLALLKALRKLGAIDE
ncbi:Maf family nucleotide pyrophosphatase [Martelella soudanensis]|uniref:Maf family nucleotide pyrophosphatase n=1 Tax=unclassified Martelella TaxID=2629616 RepID=UPI0015DD6B62|nr:MULTISPECIES: Maf family nucleotide pyrophosphatase [unclassified Martelella]